MDNSTDPVSGGPPPLSVLAKSVIGVTFGIAITWGLLGNMGVCHIVFKDLKLSVTNLFLLNLSLADILMGIFCGPFVMLNDFILGYWPFGTLICKVMPVAQGISCFVSALTHIVISVDRFVVVFYPLKQRMRQSSAVYILISIWAIAAATTAPLPFVYDLQHQNNSTYCLEGWEIFIFGNFSKAQLRERASRHNLVYTVFVMMLQYFVPLVVIVSTYSAIAFRVWIQQTPGEVDEKRDQRIAKSKKKLLKMVILVAVLYGLSKLPRHVFFLASLQDSNMWDGQYSLHFLYVWVMCVLADFSSIGYNPLIYCWMNKMFRNGFIRLCVFFVPCCVVRCPCLRRAIQKTRQRTERNTYCMSSNYEKPLQHSKAAYGSAYGPVKGGPKYPTIQEVTSL